MTDAPERIWARQYDNGVVGARARPDGDYTQYRRADLPPTLAEMKTVPEIENLIIYVEILLDALDRQNNNGKPVPQSIRVNHARYVLRAALAKLTEGRSE